ncbi:MAG: iron-sulfur cluster-binding domain-containing protein [Bacteroidota bacterium]
MPGDQIINRLRILKVIVETDNARTLLLEPVDNWKPVYKAGQFLTLVFYTPHGEKRRSFSLISSPGKDEPLAISIKKIDNGEFSRPLVYGAKTGDILFTSGIGGLFLLPENPGEKKYCFLAAGSGITPCFSLIRELLESSSATMTLLYSNKNPFDAMFLNQITELQNKHPQRLTTHLLFSNHTDLYYKRLSKWLLEQLLNKYIPAENDKTLFYLCGPYDYMQMAEIVLLNRTSKEYIIKENFSSLPRKTLPEPPDKSMHTVTIRINGETHTLKVQYPKSILKTAIENKIELPYSCEAGRCASCIATCTKGSVWLAYNEVLADKEIANGRILTCQGFPVNGDVEIVFDQMN